MGARSGAKHGSRHIRPSDAFRGNPRRSTPQIFICRHACKKGVPQEVCRIRRFLSDPISLHTINRLLPHTLSQFRDRRLQDGIRASQYDLVIIKHCLKIAKCEWGLAIDLNPVDLVQMPPSSPPETAGWRRESMRGSEALPRHCGTCLSGR